MSSRESRRTTVAEHALRFGLLLVVAGILVSSVSAMGPFGYICSLGDGPAITVEEKSLIIAEELGASVEEFAVGAAVGFAALTLLGLIARRASIRAARVAHQAQWAAVLGTLSCASYFWGWLAINFAVL